LALSTDGINSAVDDRRINTPDETATFKPRPIVLIVKNEKPEAIGLLCISTPPNTQCLFQK
jgi:hypothetical protein